MWKLLAFLCPGTKRQGTDFHKFTQVRAFNAKRNYKAIAWVGIFCPNLLVLQTRASEHAFNVTSFDSADV